MQSQESLAFIGIALKGKVSVTMAIEPVLKLDSIRNTRCSIRFKSN